MYIRQDIGSQWLSDLKDTNVIVKNTGLCFYSQIGLITVVTSFDMSKFPHDT